MKKVSRILSLVAVALVSSAAITACGGGNVAHAAPTLATNAAGTVVYGSEQAVSVEKDTSAGYNRTLVRYSSGVQYVNDDAAWTRFAKLASGFGIAIQAGPNKTYDASKTNGVYCQSGNSVIAWPNIGQPDTITDGCAFFNAVKAAAQ